jgi:hypothetical protein
MKADFKVAISVPFAAERIRGRPRAEQSKTSDPPPTRPPRIAVLMALAIHMEQLLRHGHVRDQADLSQLAGVTRARVTQVMNLLGLAPDIQLELLLSTPNYEQGERRLRLIMAVPDWKEQRAMWLRSSFQSR